MRRDHVTLTPGNSKFRDCLRNNDSLVFGGLTGEIKGLLIIVIITTPMVSMNHAFKLRLQGKVILSDSVGNVGGR